KPRQAQSPRREAKDVEFPDPATMGAAESANSAQSGYQVNSIGPRWEAPNKGAVDAAFGVGFERVNETGVCGIANAVRERQPGLGLRMPKRAAPSAA
ncbi:hypothetical protein, partial [Paraburkholderia elongata]|uniref:hypothetical protein n=1 Tax=Paraburkholderia elongata TaxID=2675747 RepID=UPI001C12E561